MNALRAHTYPEISSASGFLRVGRYGSEILSVPHPAKALSTLRYAARAVNQAVSIQRPEPENRYQRR